MVTRLFALHMEKWNIKAGDSVSLQNEDGLILWCKSFDHDCVVDVWKDVMPEVRKEAIRLGLVNGKELPVVIKYATSN